MSEEPQEMAIYEQGITRLEIMATPFTNRFFTPDDGLAKWFMDSLDQRWVKFRVTEAGSTDEHVVPASRVVEVRYRK